MAEQRESVRDATSTLWTVCLDPNGAAMRRTPLMTFAGDGDLLSMERLLQEGAAVNLQSPSDVSTALHCGASQGHLAVIQLLLKYGADRELVVS